MEWAGDFFRQLPEQLLSLDLHFLGYPLAFFGGLLTNLSPCAVFLVPLVIGYIGGYSQRENRLQAFLVSASFAAGVTITLCAIGLCAALAGTLLLPLRRALVYVVVVMAVVMGLHCIGAFRLPLKTIFKPKAKPRKGLKGAFVFGLLGGAITTPCTTPVLAVILAYVGTEARFLYGVTLLFTYCLGFVVPLLLAGAFVGFITTLKKLEERTHYQQWIARLSGIVLIAFAFYLILRV